MSCGANCGANEKSSYKKSLKLACNCLNIKEWAHQGMILSPPDYEFRYKIKSQILALFKGLPAPFHYAIIFSRF
jgi:hypothetical protein